MGGSGMSVQIRFLFMPVLLLLGAMWILSTHPPHEAPNSQPVNMTLPTTIGPWRGEHVLYCHNESCLKETIGVASTLPETCPTCDTPLHPISLPEARMLPADSEFERLLYRRGPGETAFISIVVTGTERSSIHRAEWCLPAQGLDIRSTDYLTIPTPHGDVEVAVLEVSRAGSIRPEAYYLYWFSSGSRFHTSRHGTRLLRMGLDALISGEQHRWAYISVLFRIPGTNRGRSEAVAFATSLAKELYDTSK
jgi:hypothetical protein